MSGTVPAWLESIFGVPHAGAGESTAWTLQSSWRMAPWATVLLVAALATLAVFLYLRESGAAPRRIRLLLAAMRTAVFALVLLMLAEFVLSLERKGLPFVVVAIDDSASMSVVDRGDEESLSRSINDRLSELDLGQATRLNIAKTLMLDDDAKLLETLADRYKLRVYFLSSDARAQPADVDEAAAQIRVLQAAGATSRLGQGVRGILNDLRGTPPAAIILLTDGINTEGESLAEAAAYARRKGVPLHAIGLGSSQPVRDLAVSDLLVDDIVFVDDIVQAEFALSGPGYAGRRVRATLREKGRDAPLAETFATIESDRGSEKVRLAYRPRETGDVTLIVDVEHFDDEANPDNNRIERQVSVRKEAIRVLYVQSYPSFEFRYLKHMLERQGEKTVILHTVLQESDLEYAEQDATALRVFPVRREELFQYDVVLFGDVNPAFLSASTIENLSAFVTEKGGGIVFMAGPLYTPHAYRDTPLAALMPVDLRGMATQPVEGDYREPFQPRVTPLGIASPPMYLGNTADESLSIWNDLPPLYWMFEAHRLKPAARVLAEHPVRIGDDGKPLAVIAMQYVGAGKVVLHATDETWRWRFRTGDTYFARYWMQMIRYLGRSQLLGHDRAARLTAEVAPDMVRLRARFLDERQAPSQDDGVTLVVEHQGEKSQRVTLRRSASSPGMFEGLVSKPAQGRYHAWMASPTLDGKPPAVDFEVTPPPGEMQRVEMDSAELERAAAETKGHFYTLATADELLKRLPRGRLVPMSPLPPVALWNTPLVVGLMLLILIGEWVVRKRYGML